MKTLRAKLTPAPVETAQLSRRRALVITLAALVIVYILWNVAAFSVVVYPVRLFVTFVHEAGHSLMALLTGGRVAGFSVSADGSGLARTIGGSRALILPAGYLGAALFGAGLFYITNTWRQPRIIAVIIGAALVILTVLFARPDSTGAPVAFFVGVLGGATLIALGWKIGNSLNLLVLNVLAMMTALNAVLDLFYLANNSRISAGGGTVLNDAAAFSADVAPILPGAVWAFVWALMALAMIGAAVYFSILRPLLKDQSKDRSSAT